MSIEHVWQVYLDTGFFILSHFDVNSCIMSLLITVLDSMSIGYTQLSVLHCPLQGLARGVKITYDQ